MDSSIGSTVPFGPGLGVAIHTIKPGQIFKFAPDPDKVRVCIVAAGRLRLQVDDEAPLLAGPHTVFKIPADVACSGENRLYAVAILHVIATSAY